MNKGNICVSICATTAEEIATKVNAAEQYADLIEIRFDCISPDQMEIVLRGIASSVPLMATYRSIEQGGNSSASVKNRRAFWSTIPENGYSTIDLEADIFSSVMTDRKRILSFHDHNGVPADIHDIASRMRETDAELIKIAVTAGDAVDAIPIWKLLQKDTRVIPIAMGEAGKWTRILALAHGAYLTYASLQAGSETAHGQVTARDLREIYRIKDLDLTTKVYGVIGHPVAESKSPYLHNPAFASAGINSVFIPLEVKDLTAFITRMVRPGTRELELNFAGFSVTMPHKRSIMQHLDEVDPVASSIGAVNTVKVYDGKLLGFNTDAHGFITPLKEHFGSVHGVRAAVIGAGGAARASIYALKADDADVTVLARDVKKASDLAQKFEVRSGPLDDAKPSDFDIIVNATPLGMRSGDESIFTARELKGVKFVYDLVTRTSDTLLVQEAKRAGVAAIGGLEMLISQAEMQFEIWTGQKPAAGIMKASIHSRLGVE